MMETVTTTGAAMENTTEVETVVMEATMAVQETPTNPA